jgi:hypothetical protein
MSDDRFDIYYSHQGRPLRLYNTTGPLPWVREPGGWGGSVQSEVRWLTDSLPHAIAARVHVNVRKAVPR